MNERPEPFTPPDCDLRDFGFMPIEPGRLFGSEFHARADDGAWRAGVTLWLKAWHQVPAGSLPSEDVALTRLAELGRDCGAWNEIKAGALRGWVECVDGRLYHAVVAEKALEAWIEKLVARASGVAGNAKRWGVDADMTVANDAIERAAALLAALAPQSRCLPRLARRQSRNAATFDRPAINKGSPPDRGAIAVGSPSDAKRIAPRSQRDPTATPSGSQGTVKGQGQGQGQGYNSLPPTTPGPTALAAVMKAAGMIRQPTDHALLNEWLTLPNMVLERDVIPIVERIGREVLDRTGKAAFKLKLFDPAIREQQEADEAESVRLRRIPERIDRQDREQTAQRKPEAQETRP